MNILVLGKDGQVAHSIADAAVAFPTMSLSFAGRSEVDLAVPGLVAEAVRQAAPDVVINAAAYTAVDRAESERDLAQRINAEAAGEAAAAAHEVGARFLQISTDYVFDGQLGRPYHEDDPTEPVNVYGQTKLAGEEQVRDANSSHLIIRTSWVVSPYGTNFVKTMLRLAAERDTIRVVGDQLGCPTSALELAPAILALAGAFDGQEGGTIHLAGSGSASWAQLAAEVIAQSLALGGPSASVDPITTADYPTPATRPADTRLDCSRAQERFAIVLPDWRASVARIVARLVT